jgi:L-alanine-DL-glutamate epimerase-like enolase superfamily enzyme
MVPYLKKNRIEWLEEPVFPPENSEAWAQLRAQGINIAAGENFCTLEGFIPFLPFLNYVQPSVTKIGGITEFLRVAEAVRSSGKKLAAHSPYFGPGYWASLQLASAIESFDLFEYLYVKPEASCGLHIPLPQKGTISIPDNPGIGFEPDFTIIEKYRVNS